MFVAMIAPGLVGCLASLLAAVLRNRQEQRHTTAMHGAYTSQSPHSSDADNADLVDIATLRLCSLEALLGLNLDRLPWRVIAAAWLRPSSIGVPVGITSQGPFIIDLARQGPHALVAGTTGSGKSILLQAWCLAIAARNPPTAVHFVFLDFKGGAAFRILEALPHTAGSVCDLDLSHAVRALNALEDELTRRERLVAQACVGSVDMLSNPPPRLVVVIDEFYALRNQLPDGIERVVRVASLGRSLGMHVIACTQNPLGQVSSDMKANMSLNICMRVRDGVQSAELIGSPYAASISPSLPGAAYCADGNTVTAMRCCPPAHSEALVKAVMRAAAFHQIPRCEPLFTAPLPREILSWSDMTRYGALARDSNVDAGGNDTGGNSNGSGNNCNDLAPVPCGLADDGVRLHIAYVPIGKGNVAIIGRTGSGRSTLIHLLANMLCKRSDITVQMTSRSTGEYHTTVVRTTCQSHSKPSHSPIRSSQQLVESPHTPHLVWLCDDADELLNTLGNSELHQRFRHALDDPTVTVMVAVEDSRRIHDLARYAARLVFPTGDRPTDLMDGIPADVLTWIDRDKPLPAGRCVLMQAGQAMPVQCLKYPPSPVNNKSSSETS